MKKLDIAGKLFGYLTPLHEVPNAGLVSWLCLCKCGTEVVASTKLLTRGAKTSCGCKKADNKRTHGMSKTSTYHIWAEMRARCLNKDHKAYHYYGGRGITVVKDWANFENFLRDMGERPEGLSLARVRNNEGYSPENCIWANRLAQARNNRGNRLIPYEGEQIPISLAVERRNAKSEKKLKYSTVRSRICLYGWSVERALALEADQDPTTGLLNMEGLAGAKPYIKQEKLNASDFD